MVCTDAPSIPSSTASIPRVVSSTTPVMMYWSYDPPGLSMVSCSPSRCELDIDPVVRLCVPQVLHLVHACYTTTDTCGMYLTSLRSLAVSILSQDLWYETYYSLCPCSDPDISTRSPHHEWMCVATSGCMGHPILHTISPSIRTRLRHHEWMYVSTSVAV